MAMHSIWFTVSLVFCLAEIILPGQVSIGLGIAGLMVALLIWLGVIDGWPSAFVVWFIASPLAVLGMRAVFSRFFPGESVRQSTDEDQDLAGKVVEVIETIEHDRPGRVAFGDSSWPAICPDGRLERGMAARLLIRDGLCWVVKPILE